MEIITFVHNDKEHTAKITWSRRNGRTYYWVDVYGKSINIETGKSFTFLRSNDHDISCLTPVTPFNKSLMQFFKNHIATLQYSANEEL